MQRRNLQKDGLGKLSSEVFDKPCKEKTSFIFRLILLAVCSSTFAFITD